MRTQKKKLRIYWIASLLMLAVVFIIMELDPRYNPITMVLLEFAPSQQAFFEIMAENNYSMAFIEKCLYLDFAFIITFTLLFCFSLLLYRKSAEHKIRRLLLCCLPGILDVIENILMLQMVRHGSIDDATYGILKGIVYIKWILVLPLILMALLVIYRQGKEIWDEKLQQEALGH